MIEAMNKKQIIIDPRGGIAGDMFSAALISAGAEEDRVVRSLVAAAEKLGKAEIGTRTTSDGSLQLHIRLHANHHHLSADKARAILSSLYGELKVETPYQQLGSRILEILLHAEDKAHREHPLLIKKHSHHQGIQLHEAQDIIIDIIGAVIGMQDLKLACKATLLFPVSVGGGLVEFSHGRLPVPAPATEIILNQHQISWQSGPIQQELCTPTGAAILAALQAEVDKNIKPETLESAQSGFSRGSKLLQVPPLTIYLIAKE
jgi:uncharacterized protein (DUF111 family)